MIIIENNEISKITINLLFWPNLNWKYPIWKHEKKPIYYWVLTQLIINMSFSVLKENNLRPVPDPWMALITPNITTTNGYYYDDDRATTVIIQWQADQQCDIHTL